MTYQIKKSILRGIDFSLLVNDYITELKAYDKHMKFVESGKADPYPAPDAPTEVKEAVRMPEMIADYEIVDDDSTPAQILADKKNELTYEVGTLEHQAIETVLPQRKMRLHNIELTDIHAAIAKRSRFKRTPTKDEAKKLDKNQEISNKLYQIGKHGALLTAEIEDLTEQTIDAWKPIKFPV